MINVVKTEGGSLGFPDFEGGPRPSELVQQIASALSTAPRKPIGSPLEVLIGFDGYPDAFALWWDGFTSELGCSERGEVDMARVEDLLRASGAFKFSE